MRNHGPDTVNVALYVSPCCADIERNRSKKGGFFLQETMPCIHGPSLCVCVCMLALVVAVLIAYDYECGRKLSASLFLGSLNQAFLASWLWALIVVISWVSKKELFFSRDRASMLNLRGVPKKHPVSFVNRIFFAEIQRAATNLLRDVELLIKSKKCVSVQKKSDKLT